jgi:glycolate oxidase
VADALALGGTVTGEHGVGLLKRPGLAGRAEPGGARPLHRAVKQGGSTRRASLNPGKIF